MTLEEIDALMPNGLHDAEISSINLDIVNQRASFELLVWVALKDTDASAKELVYRPGKMSLDGLTVFALEHHDQCYDLRNGMSISSFRRVNELTHSPGIRLPQVTAADGFLYGLFLPDMNATLYLGGRAFSFVWNE